MSEPTEPTLDLKTSLWNVDGFNYRALGRFRYMQIQTVGELMEWSWWDLHDVRAMGEGTLANIVKVLAEEGLVLKDTPGTRSI